MLNDVSPHMLWIFPKIHTLSDQPCLFWDLRSPDSAGMVTYGHERVNVWVGI